MKTIDVCYVAWPRDIARTNYLMQSLESFRKNVSAADHNIEVHVSLETLDVSTEHFGAARKICEKYGARPYWRNMPPSLGGNQNDALMLGRGDYKLSSQDDWVWLTPHDISADADVLETRPGAALVRYACYGTVFRGVFLRGEKFYHVIDNTGPYPYGDQPHIRRADFATRKSATGGNPVGFYFNSETGDYATPENNFSEHLSRNGWEILAHVPNIVEHCGTLSSCPLRRIAV